MELSITQIGTQEGGYDLERFRGGAQESEVGREHVNHALPDMEFGDRTGSCDAAGHAPRIFEQDFVFPNMKHDRRQAGQIAI